MGPGKVPEALRRPSGLFCAAPRPLAPLWRGSAATPGARALRAPDPTASPLTPATPALQGSFTLTGPDPLEISAGP